MRTIAISFLFCLTCVTLGAQRVEKVTTKDGTIYEGYISEQIPGKQITVFAEMVTRTVPSSQVQDYRTDSYPYQSLTRVGQKWFQENGDVDNIVLASFEYDGDYFDQVVVIRKDAKDTRFISFTPRSYRLPWSQVAKTAKLMLPQDPYGLRDVISMTDGVQYSGQILEQGLLEKTVRIRPDGSTPVTLVSSDVLSLRVEAIDPQVSLLKQAFMLDRLILNDGEIIEGVIVSRVLGKKVMIHRTDDVEESIPLGRIVKYQKCWNKGYVPYIAPVVDTQPSMLMNESSFQMTPTFLSGDGWFAMETYKYTVPAGSVVKLQIKNVDVDATAQMYKASRIKYTYKKDRDHYGQIYPMVAAGSFPMYEVAFTPQGENVRVCELQIRQKGIYFITLKGNDNVLLIETE